MNTPVLTGTRLREAGIGMLFRPGQLKAVGISYDQLRRLVEAGVVERVARGLYRLRAAEPTENHGLAAVCARIPRSIVCLLTALRVHGIGSQLPREVWLAIPHKARPPKPPGVAIRLIRFSGPAWTCGIEPCAFEGVPAWITNPARTIVDCFRFERLIGREAAMDAVRDALRNRKVTVEALDRILAVLPSRRLGNVLEAIDP